MGSLPENRGPCVIGDSGKKIELHHIGGDKNPLAICVPVCVQHHRRLTALQYRTGVLPAPKDRGHIENVWVLVRDLHNLANLATEDTPKRCSSASLD